MPFKHFYRRRLPHFQHDDATYFVTSRLSDSLPSEVLEKLSIEHEARKASVRRTAASETEFLFKLDEENRRHFGQMDRCLHRVESGSHFFRDPITSGFFSKIGSFSTPEAVRTDLPDGHVEPRAFGVQGTCERFSAAQNHGFAQEVHFPSLQRIP